MTPRQFETDHAALWTELENGLEALDAGRRRPAPWRVRFARNKATATTAQLPETAEPIGAARIARLYRQCCEHLALASERAYPVHLVVRLEELTARAHQRIYRRHDFGLGALRDLVLFGIPDAVRGMGWHLVVALVVFLAPMVGVGIATWLDPHFILTVSSVADVRDFDKMYGPEHGEHLGRTAGDDWQMFGYYIAHNIGLAFQCYATGLTLGLGSLGMLAFNGALLGGVAGFLVTRGDGERFFSFVVTHSAFELTAIVLSGAAGLRLGHALLAPGRRTRTDALRHAALETTPVMYGAFAFLLTAAALEAFWSSAGWIAPVAKYIAGACCWALVLAYLGLQGRGDGARDAGPAVDRRDPPRTGSR